MAASLEQKGGGPLEWLKTEPEKIQKKLEAWFKKQPLPVEVAVLTIGGSFQGAALGALMGTISQNQPKPPPGSPMAANPTMMGGPLVQARNFAVLTGVNAGLAAAVKKWRGKDDCQTAMIASFGSGAAFALVSGLGNTPQGGGPITSAIVTGTMFALFQGAFYQLGKSFFGGENSEADQHYLRTKYMLSNLGLEKYEKNFKKGMLDDSTLMLINDSALQECKIPPGPRLHIMHHLDSYRNILKPGAALPLPPPPPMEQSGKK